MIHHIFLQRMDLKSKSIQLQYQGYLNTPLLWENYSFFGLNQLEIPKQNTHLIDQNISDNLRLGKRAERFLISELRQNKNVEILVENAQIQNQKITVGEIDCILKLNEVLIHLEVIYKFYLFDSRVGNSEIDHWIGPNRNDSLLKKINKLRNKQLPLINSVHSQPLLNSINLNSKDLIQRVCFKAQLFIPYNTELQDFELLNKDCLSGFYIHFSKIEQFSGCKFFIPAKVDWLIEAHSQVDWLEYGLFHKKTMWFLNKKRAPLIWVLFPTGIVQKLFIVWWN